MGRSFAAERLRPRQDGGLPISILLAGLIALNAARAGESPESLVKEVEETLIEADRGIEREGREGFLKEHLKINLTASLDVLGLAGTGSTRPRAATSQPFSIALYSSASV